MLIERVASLCLLAFATVLAATLNNSTIKNTQSENATSTNSSKLMRKASDDIIFPDTPDNEETRKPVKRMPDDNCINNICDEVDNYPAEQILRWLNTDKSYEDYFVAQQNVPILDRNNFIDGENLCPSKTVTKYPRRALNINNESKDIVNIDNYTQGVHVEICANDGSVCKLSFGFPEGYETQCQQRYSVRRLLASSKGSKPAFDTFELPSCCICLYRRV